MRTTQSPNCLSLLGFGVWKNLQNLGCFCAINAGQIEVTFSKVVDEDSAKTLANYSINGTALNNASFSGATASLKADGRTLVITLDSSDRFVNDSAYSIVVKDVKDTDGAKVEKYTKTVVFSDTAAPSIVTVSATAKTDTNTATITFDEPVAGTGVYKIDGVGVAVASGQGTNELTLSTGKLEAGKTYTLFVANETDISSAANNLPSSEYSFTVTVDDVSPVATVEAASDKTIKVTFNEAVKANTVTTSNLRIKDSNGFIYAQANAPTTTDNKTFTLTLASNPFVGDATTADFKVNIANVEDVAGNKMTSVVKDVTLTKDDKAPTYVATTDVTTAGFNIEFSENVTKNGTPGITIVSSKGVEVAGVVGTVTNKKLAVTATLTEGETYTYTLAKEAVQDTAWTPNKSEVVMGSFTVDGDEDSSKPAVVTTGGNEPQISTTNNNYVVINFDEPVKGGSVSGSATDVYNYKLDGKALPEGTVITLDSAMDTATIKLPAGSFSAAGTKQLTVQNIQDKAGNVLNTSTHAVTVVDTAAPVLKSATVNQYSSAFVVDLYFNEDLTGTATQAISNIDRNIKLMNGNVEITGFTATLQNDTDGNPRIVRLTKTSTALDASKAVTVETKAATTLAQNVVLDTATRTDSLGVSTHNPLKAGVKVTAVDGVAPTAPVVTQTGGDVITANGVALSGSYTANEGVTSIKVKYEDSSDLTDDIEVVALLNTTNNTWSVPAVDLSTLSDGDVDVTVTAYKNDEVYTSASAVTYDLQKQAAIITDAKIVDKGTAGVDAGDDVVITFDKALASSITTPAGLGLEDSGGALLFGTGASLAVSADGKTATITLGTLAGTGNEVAAGDTITVTTATTTGGANVALVNSQDLLLDIE